jgi:microcystin-dependent protein
MADSYTGEIRILPFTFAPLDWAWCNGQSIAVQQNQVLYSVIANLYGGDRNAFNLPNMMSTTTGNIGAAPIGMGAGTGLTPRALSPTSFGTPTVTLGVAQIPAHNHSFTAQNTSVTTNIIASPSNAWLSRGIVQGTSPVLGFQTYVPENPATATTFRDPLSTSGGGGAHDNIQPSLAVNFCISLYGTYPVRS